ncbi:MAG: DUF1697 domain-containing protein [Actinomycetes bacterium]
MPTHVVLLRGVNVGGNSKVPMAALRERLERDGFTRVRTYIQSGNVLVDSRASSAKVASTVAGSIAEEFGVDVPVIALALADLARVVAGNPYPAEKDHKRLHAIFLPGEPDAAARARLDELSAKFTGSGSNDSLKVIGSTLYLHTPGGFGISELAKALTTKGRLASLNGTARNWATVTTLLAMAEE